MSNLKTLVESIVTDLVSARFEADLKIADLALHYRDDPALSALNVPTLNISNASVELRFVFDDTAIEEATEPSAEQTEAIGSVSDALSQWVMTLASVRAAPANTRRALPNKLRAALKRSASAHLASAGATRRNAMESEISSLLSDNRVRPTTEELANLKAKVKELDATITAAPGAPPVSLPQLIVGASALKNIDPNLVSNIKFDVNLSVARWAEVDDESDGTHSVLTDA